MLYTTYLLLSKIAKLKTSKTVDDIAKPVNAAFTLVNTSKKDSEQKQNKQMKET